MLYEVITDEREQARRLDARGVGRRVARAGRKCVLAQAMPLPEEQEPLGDRRGDHETLGLERRVVLAPDEPELVPDKPRYAQRVGAQRHPDEPQVKLESSVSQGNQFQSYNFG